MENTIDNAKSFLTKYRDERTHPVSVDYFAEMMVAFASACSAPSSIGEDEKNRIVQEVIEMHPYKVPGKPDTYCDYNQGWEDACDILDQHLTKYAISRISERKIVLPSEEEIKTDMVVKMILKHLAIMDEKLINIQSKLNNL